METTAHRGPSRRRCASPHCCSAEPTDWWAPHAAGRWGKGDGCCVAARQKEGGKERCCGPSKRRWRRLEGLWTMRLLGRPKPTLSPLAVAAAAVEAEGRRCCCSLGSAVMRTEARRRRRTWPMLGPLRGCRRSYCVARRSCCVDIFVGTESESGRSGLSHQSLHLCRLRRLLLLVAAAVPSASAVGQPPAPADGGG